MVGANFEAARITSKANVGKWHIRDLQPLAFLGPPTAGKPTTEPERRFTGVFQTRFRGTLNAY